MRVLSLTLLMFVAVLVFGVFSHHMLTTGLLLAAVIGIASCGAVCLLISAAAIRASKKEARLWPRISASVVHLIFAIGFLDALRSLDYPPPYKIASAVTGLMLAFCGVILLLAPSKKEPIQPPQTTTGSSAPDRV